MKTSIVLFITFSFLSACATGPLYEPAELNDDPKTFKQLSQALADNGNDGSLRLISCGSVIDRPGIVYCEGVYRYTPDYLALEKFKAAIGKVEDGSKRIAFYAEEDGDSQLAAAAVEGLVKGVLEGVFRGGR